MTKPEQNLGSNVGDDDAALRAIFLRADSTADLDEMAFTAAIMQQVETENRRRIVVRENIVRAIAVLAAVAGAALSPVAIPMLLDVFQQGVGLGLEVDSLAEPLSLVVPLLLAAAAAMMIMPQNVRQR